jgi:hypothetical protein
MKALFAILALTFLASACSTVSELPASTSDFHVIAYEYVEPIGYVTHFKVKSTGECFVKIFESSGVAIAKAECVK